MEDKHIEPLLPKIREPRIFCMPVTLGLLINSLFYEFPTDDTEFIKAERCWLNLVRMNEDAVLVPFFQRCAQLAGKDGVIFSEKLYAC